MAHYTYTHNKIKTTKKVGGKEKKKSGSIEIKQRTTQPVKHSQKGR